ncbi:hypothetical protein MTO96_048915 [Rhipicephalus appendiculatus]
MAASRRTGRLGFSSQQPQLSMLFQHRGNVRRWRRSTVFPEKRARRCGAAAVGGWLTGPGESHPLQSGRSLPPLLSVHRSRARLLSNRKSCVQPPPEKGAAGGKTLDAIAKPGTCCTVEREKPVVRTNLELTRRCCGVVYAGSGGSRGFLFAWTRRSASCWEAVAQSSPRLCLAAGFRCARISCARVRRLTSA